MSKRQKKHLYRSIIICSFLAVIIVAVTAGILFTVNSNNKDSAANDSSYESAASTDAVPSSASDNSTYSSDSVSSFCRIFSLGIIVCDSYRFIPPSNQGRNCLQWRYFDRSKSMFAILPLMTVRLKR